MRKMVRTDSANGAGEFSADSMLFLAPFLGLLSVDSSNKEHILCLDLFLLRPHFPLHPVHFLFLHSCWLYPDYLLKLSFTFVLTTGHLFLPLPQSNYTESRVS